MNTVVATGPKKSPRPIDVEVGSRIRLRRIKIGMSQEKLAEALGITFQQVQKYEKGTNRVGASRLFDVANVLQVGIAELFPEKDDVSGDNIPKLSTQALQFASVFDRLTVSEKKAVGAVIRVFLEGDRGDDGVKELDAAGL